MRVPKKIKLFVSRYRRWCLTGGLCLFFGASIWWGIPWFFPLPESLSGYVSPGATVLDRHGVVMARLPGDGYYLGESRPLADIPQDFIKATLVAEDKRFFSHGGLDILSFFRALKSNISSGKVVSGASTISQQLIKISSPRGGRTFPVKIREFFQARHLEMVWDKEEILSAYFERLDYGNLRVGPVAAARFYFSKSLEQLSLAEAALLSGLPQAPSRLNPLRNPERARKRRDWILQRLQTEEDYSEDRISRALTEKLECVPYQSKENEASHVMSRLLAKKVGGVVKTTLDAALQKEIRGIVQNELALLKEQEAGQAAVLVMDNATGEILAWVGSAHRADPRGGQLDGVLIPRSAGSTLKPFVYALGFRAGSWAGEIIPDIPTFYRSPNGADAPGNFNNRFRGPLSVREALACSQNIPVMRMLERVGGENAFTEFLRNFGFVSFQKPRGEYGLGLAIGNAEITLFELVQAYGSLAHEGKRLNAHIEPGAERTDSSEYLLSSEISFVLADILSDQTARATAFGWESSLNLPFKCAVKTGTSSDFRDNWCVGFTKEITIGVWVGNFDFRRMKGVSGLSGAGPIFHATMLAAHRSLPPTFPTPPEGVVSVSVDSRTGHQISDSDLKEPSQYIGREWAFLSTPPPVATSSDYDEQGRALLDPRYAEWYKGEDNTLEELYALEKGETIRENPRILEPVNGATLVLDPEIPGEGRILRLKSNLPESAVWSSPTLKILMDKGYPAVELVPGTHLIKVTISQDGGQQEATARITVKRV